MEFLSHLGEAERERYVKHYEAGGGSLLIDPVELAPVAVPRIASIWLRIGNRPGSAHVTCCLQFPRVLRRNDGRDFR